MPLPSDEPNWGSWLLLIVLACAVTAFLLVRRLSVPGRLDVLMGRLRSGRVQPRAVAHDLALLMHRRLPSWDDAALQQLRFGRDEPTVTAIEAQIDVARRAWNVRL